MVRRAICVMIVALGLSTEAYAENDPCGWLAWGISAGVVAGVGYLVPPPAGEAISGVFTLASAVYLALDYVKAPCAQLDPPQVGDDATTEDGDDQPGGDDGTDSQP